MKLIIDIPEQIWEMVVNTGTFGCYRFNTSRAIRKGVPLDKIRAEIEEVVNENETIDSNNSRAQNIGLMWVLQIIDKYKAESEE